MRKEWLLVIPSVLLYIFAPDHYEWAYCALCCLVFLIGALFVLYPEIKKGNYFSFNFVFFFAYFWTSFAYPILIYGSRADRGNVINNAIDWQLLSHTSALALLFVIAYIVGFTSYTKKNKHKDNSIHSYKSPTVLYIICLLAYVGTAIYGFLTTGRGNMATGKFLIDIYFTVLSICLVVNVKNNYPKYKHHNILLFFQSNKMLIISSFVVFSVFIALGDRMPAIKTIITVFAVYYIFWDKIKLRYIAITGGLLLLLLFFVRQARSSDIRFAKGNVTTETIKDAFNFENGALYMFADLFFINRELCLGYEYSQKYELYYPERLLIAPLTPIPFLPSLISKAVFGVSPSEMETGSRLAKMLGTEYDIEGHLGNHPASDLLMSFDILGVILIAFFMGRGIGYVQANSYSNIYMSVCYIVLMGWSLYLARSTTLYLIRPVGYALLFIYLLYHKSNKKYRRR